MNPPCLSLLLLAVALGRTLAAPAANPAFAPIKEKPHLPHVLLIGDSISIAYTLPARQRLAGQANLHRIPINGSSTTNGLARIDEWLGVRQWDVIHFNWGLHDLKVMTNGAHMIPLPEYERNLDKLVQRLQATGARLIWASTTPVPTGRLAPPRRPGDEIPFNTAARRVMERHGVAINDLHALASAAGEKIQPPSNVHFTDRGYELLAERVAEAVGRALKRKKVEALQR